MKEIEFLFGGAPLRLLVSDDAGVGGMVWEAASVLAEWLRSKCGEQRVLELGSGTGVLGLCLATLGAKHVTLTDRFDVLPLLQASVDANRNLVSSVSVCELAWGEALPKDLPVFDMLVASEVIYNGNLYDKLLATFRDLLRANPNAPIIMSFERRSSEDRWLEMMNNTFKHVELHSVLSGSKKEISILECRSLK